MITFEIPLTTAEEIGQRLDAIGYHTGTPNEKIGRNLLATNYNRHNIIYLTVEDDMTFDHWCYTTTSDVVKIPLKEILLGSI